MTICKSWERQVLENTEAIKALQEGGGSELEEQVSELNQQMARTLKLPMSSSPDTRLVAVSVNDQEMLSIGSGLAIEYGSLVATGGGGGGGTGSMTFISELTFDGQDFSLPGNDCLISIRSSSWRATAVIAGQGEESYPYVFSTEFIYPDMVGDIQKGYIESQDGTCYLRLPSYDYESPITIYAKAI